MLVQFIPNLPRGCTAICNNISIVLGILFHFLTLLALGLLLFVSNGSSVKFSSEECQLSYHDLSIIFCSGLIHYMTPHQEPCSRPVFHFNMVCWEMPAGCTSVTFAWFASEGLYYKMLKILCWKIYAWWAMIVQTDSRTDLEAWNMHLFFFWYAICIKLFSDCESTHY